MSSFYSLNVDFPRNRPAIGCQSLQNRKSARKDTPNQMSIRVFAWDANPNVDRHLYPQSNRRAAEIVGSGRGEYIQLADGRTAVQLKASPVERAEKSIGTNNLVPIRSRLQPHDAAAIAALRDPARRRLPVHLHASIQSAKREDHRRRH
jgi:hypothetical protein